MNTNIHELLIKNLLIDLTSRIQKYLVQNNKNLNGLSFDLKPNSLGIDIIHFEKDNNYLINFNNEKRLSYKKDPNNSFIFTVKDSGLAKFSNVTINNSKIDRGILLTENHYNFLINHSAKFMDSYIYSINNPVIDKEYKLEILSKFESLLNRNPKELIIDNFIEKHPFIVELSLHLTNLNHQLVLKNIEEEFEQDLKPDVIAYRPLDKCWCIVDYKRANRKVLKNSGKVRSGFMAEVNSLTNQIDDYINYFVRSREQSKYIKDKYGLDVKFPKGIGIIGNLHSEDGDAYLKASRKLPKEIEVYPYNYIIDECKRVLALQ